MPQKTPERKIDDSADDPKSDDATIDASSRASDDHVAKAALIFIGAFLLGLLIVVLLPRSLTLPFPRPFDEPRTWLMVLFFLGFPALVMVAITSRLREFRRAAAWTEGVARITKSEVGVERRKRAGEATQVFNKPVIEYEFKAGSRLMRGDRIAIGDDPEHASGIVALLARFPLGSEVPVYFDPAHSQDSLLDRTHPLRTEQLVTLGIVFALAGVAIVLLVLRADEIMDWLRARFPERAEPPAAIFFALTGFTSLAILIAHIRTAARTARWPVVRGRIVSSVVDSFLLKGGAKSGARVRVYQAVIEYAYTLDGREFHCSRERFGAVVSSGKDLAEARAARYVAGGEVDVHYDPRDPTEGVLEPCVAFKGWILVLTLVMFGLAVFFAGVLG